MRIQHNLSALFSQRILSNTDTELKSRLAKLASGLRINTAADDAAGLAISEKLRTQVNGIQQAYRNAQDGISVAQTAEGGMQEIQNMAQRLRQLSVQASNDTLTDSDRALIQKEVGEVKAEIDRFAETVQFNEKPLLNGDYAVGTNDLTLHVGANEDQTVDVNIAEMNTTALGIGGVDVSTRAGAEQSIGALDTALTTVSAQRANLGATQNRLSNTFDFLRIQEESTTASESRIRDADMAQQLIGLTQAQLLQNSGTAMLAQANLTNQSILGLLG